MKLVTAIITTHNRKKLLKRAIESVLSQTYKRIECIVIDDKSDDGTDLLCKEYPIQYIYIPLTESKGGNYARNKGIKAAKGEYVAFLDDDDYWLPTKIEKQVDLIEEKDCELVHCGRILEIKKDNNIKYEVNLPIQSNIGDMSRKILFMICPTTSNMLIKRTALFNVGLFDENLGFWQDYELTIRLAQRTPFYFVNEPLSVYRINANDTNRLTNKYYAWKEAVSYIQKKHGCLYKRLRNVDKLKVKLLIWNDAAMRAKSSNLLYHYLFYKILTLPLIVKRKVNKLIH